MAWTPFSVAAPAGELLADDTVTYGPDIPREDQLKLLGSVQGKRIVDLGCGAGRNSIALARAGARTIAVDADADQLAIARAAIDAAEVKVELNCTSLAELAFLRADTIDAVLSVWALQDVEDLGRVFRQVHRVLTPEMPFVFALPHPTFGLIDPNDPEPARIRRSAFDHTAYPVTDVRAGSYNRSISSMLTELHRAGFRVDTVAEPAPTPGSRGPHWTPAMEALPATLVIRARKEGI